MLGPVVVLEETIALSAMVLLAEFFQDPLTEGTVGLVGGDGGSSRLGDVDLDVRILVGARWRIVVVIDDASEDFSLNLLGLRHVQSRAGGVVERRVLNGRQT